MSTTTELLDAVKRVNGLESDYQLAKHLGASTQMISAYRDGVTLGDGIAMKVAEELKLKPAAVLTAMHAERARSEDVRKILEAAVRKLGGIAAGAVLAIGAASFGALPSPAQAGFNNSQNMPTPSAGPRAGGMHNDRRRRRSTWAVALATLLGVSVAACSSSKADDAASSAATVAAAGLEVAYTVNRHHGAWK